MSSFIHSKDMAWSPNVKMYHVTLATPTWGIDSPHKALLRYFCSVLQPSSIRGLATPWTYFLHLSLSSVILIDSSTESPVHVLVLSIQAVRGLPRLRAPGIVPCIISFSMQYQSFHLKGVKKFEIHGFTHFKDRGLWPKNIEICHVTLE